jgi:hypothetical protein
MPLYSGLDLGQQKDNAAFVLNDPDCSVWPPIHRIISIKMWELGTRYEQIEVDLRDMIVARKLPRHRMGVEINGPGPRVVESMQHMMPADVEPIYTCGGSGITVGPEGYLHIAKGQILISTLMAAMVSNRIQVAENIFWQEELYRQLEVFGIKISKAGNEQFEAIGEAKDDLVLALSFAIVLAEHFGSMGKEQLRMVAAAGTPPADKLQRALGGLLLPQQTAANEWTRVAGSMNRNESISRAIFGPSGRPEGGGFHAGGSGRRRR